MEKYNLTQLENPQEAYQMPNKMPDIAQSYESKNYSLQEAYKTAKEKQKQFLIDLINNFYIGNMENIRNYITSNYNRINKEYDEKKTIDKLDGCNEKKAAKLAKYILNNKTNPKKHISKQELYHILNCDDCLSITGNVTSNIELVNKLKNEEKQYLEYLSDEDENNEEQEG